MGTKLGETAEIECNEWTVHRTTETADLDRQDDRVPDNPTQSFPVTAGSHGLMSANGADMTVDADSAETPRAASRLTSQCPVLV
jgi:hypothetical protein